LASLAHTRFPSPPRQILSPVLLALVMLSFVIVLVPVGYVGAGGDDWHYVEAARCAANHVYCLPGNHWGTRWPLVLPMGLVFRWFGDGELQSMAVPLAYSIAACTLLVAIVRRTCGVGAALVGALVFTTTAGFARGVLQPNVETVELVYVLAAANAALIASRTRSIGWAVGAGIVLAIATQARMTSLAWLPILAIGAAMASRDDRRLMMAAMVGFLIPVAAECAIYAIWSGDPLLAFHLSSEHTRIATTELPASVDLARSPLFNPQFIAGWRPAMHIDVHWTVNGVLNLLANPQVGPVLLAAVFLAWLRRNKLTWRDPAVIALGAGVLYIGALIYGLAIDPKGRMFLPAAAIGAILVARFAVECWNGGERPLATLLVAALVVTGLVDTTAQRFRLGVAGPLAGAWAREHPGDVSVGNDTRRMLTFDPTIRTLPVFPAGEQRHLLIASAAPCAEARPGDQWTLTRGHDFGRRNDPFNLCEFARGN